MRNKQIRELWPYVVALVLTGTFVALLSLAVGFSVPQALLFAIGLAILVWAGIFTVIQFSRASKPAEHRRVQESEPDVKRVVVVQPPTGEPEQHHEYHPESPGLDQGQLTAHHIPGSTPLIEDQPRNRR